MKTFWTSYLLQNKVEIINEKAANKLLPQNFMITWKSKLFGDNRMNFYGSIGMGLLTIGFSIYIVVMAIRAGALRSPSCLLLGAIYFIALGHFGIALQNYCARVAKTIETEDMKKKEVKAVTISG